MPPIPDYIRILTDAGSRAHDDVDARLARARVPPLRSRIATALRGWRTAPAAAPAEGVALRVQRDARGHSPDRP